MRLYARYTASQLLGVGHITGSKDPAGPFLGRQLFRSLNGTICDAFNIRAGKTPMLMWLSVNFSKGTECPPLLGHIFNINDVYCLIFD